MKMKKVFAFFLLVSMLVFIIAGCGSSGADKPADNAKATGDMLDGLPEMTITYAHANNADPKNSDHAAALAFKEHVETYSKGKIKVEISPGGALGNTAQLQELCMIGEIEVAGSSTEGTIAAVYPNIQVIAIPYLFDTVDQAIEVFKGDFGKAMFEEMRQKTGLRVVGVWDNGGFRCFTNSKRPIKSPADMKGLKIRTMDIPAHMEIVKRLGGVATPISWAELYTALETGVVDGQENAIPTIIMGSVHEVQKYLILDNHVYTQMHTMVNDKWFESLPEAYKMIILTAGEKAATVGATMMRAYRDYGLDLVSKHMQIYDPTREEVNEFRKLTQEPVLKFIREKVEDPAWVDKILQAAKDTNKRLGYTD